MIFSYTAEKAAFINDIICDASLKVEGIAEVAVGAVTKDIAIDEVEENGDEVCDLSQI